MGWDVGGSGFRIVLVGRRAGGRRGAPRRRRRGLPRRPRPQDRRHRHLGRAPGRPQGAGGDGAHARPARRRAATGPGSRWPGWATCRRPRCCTCSPTPWPTSRRRPARPGCCWRWGRASAPSWCCCGGEQRRRSTSGWSLAVGAERVVELVVSERNRRWSLARGGVESGAGHYPVMVVLHTGLLVGAVAEVLPAGPAVPAVAGLADARRSLVAAQVLRWWCIAILGPAVVHPGRRRARAVASVTRRAVPLAAAPQLPRRRGRGVRAAAGAHRLGHRGRSSPWPTRCCCGPGSPPRSGRCRRCRRADRR